MRRILAFVLAAVMLLWAVPVHGAPAQPAFAVDTVTAAAGERVDVTVRVRNSPGVTSVKLLLEYDGGLTLLNVAGNPSLGDKFLRSPEGVYPVILNWYDGLKNVTGDWVFVTLTFAVAQDASAGSYPVSITYDANDVFDFDEENVHFDIENGGVEVKSANVSVTGVTLDKTSLSLTEGQSAQLTAAVTPADATDPRVSFASSHPEIASVDAAGKVTAHKAGTATVTVTTADGGKTASCAVTVSCAHGSKTEVGAKAADCVTAGNHMYYVCNTCAQVFKADGVTETTVEAETVPATGHTLKTVDAADPSCEQDGSIAYYTCACGAWFLDEKASQPITDKSSVVVGKLGHSFTNYIPDNNETCVEDGTQSAKCDRCDATDTRKMDGSREDAVHRFPDGYISDHNASCTADGTKHRVCTLCGEKETVTDVGSALGHDYLSAVTEPTCAALGYTAYTCTRCADSYVGSYVAATEDHDYTGGVCAGCGNCVLGTDWLTPDFAQGDYTVAVLPDTQNTVELAPDTYYKLTGWIADNRDAMNIRAVLHLGDMVNQNTAQQWQIAKKGMDQIGASGAAWMPMRGNHDDSVMFNQYFDYSTYGSSQSWFGGSYEQGKLDHTYWFFTVGDRTYLVLSLGWAPGWDVLDWAEEIVAENPDKNVILTSHAYMNYDGTLLEKGDVGSVSSYEGLEGYPEGTDIWARMSKYSNVVLAMGGHVSSNDLVVYKGSNAEGRPIASILADAQTMDLEHPLGMVMLLTFHEGSDTVDINWYSAEYDALYREENQFDIELPHVHNHVYTSQVADPTCTEPGYTLFTCQCGNTYQADFVDALGHESVADPALEATCTQPGRTEGSHCALCGEVLEEQQAVPALGHSVVTDASVSPTCTQTGLTEGSHCDRCGTVLVAQKQIAALGHGEVVDAAVSATCSKSGLTRGTHCDRCGAVLIAQTVIPAKGHTEVTDKAVAAACTDTGLTEGKHCSVCDTVLTAQQVIPALGHSYKSTVVAPGAETQGYTEHICGTCGHTYRDSYTNPTGHNTRLQNALDATCTAAGYTGDWICVDCGKITEAGRVIPALGHKAVTDKAAAPTCTETGLTAGEHCAVCAEVLKAQTVLPAKGHSYGQWYVTKAATCSQAGQQRRDCQHCTHCETASVPPKGHAPAADAAVEAGCSETGLTAGEHCAVCGEVLKAQTVIPAKGHSYGAWIETKAPSCTLKGAERRACADCDHFETREVAQKGHSYTETVTAPTCSEQGYTTYICAACGDSYVDSYKSATGHKWDGGVVTKEPTDREEGIRTYTCTACGSERTQTVPKLNHTHVFSPSLTKPTCTQEGYTTFLCSCGASYVTQKKDPLGHEWGQWEVTKEPNYLEPGERIHSCTRCDASQAEPVNHNPFTDVGESNRFKTPILWAYYAGITSGKTATTFAPNSEVTRAQFVTFLWRAAGSPEPKSQENPFTDVSGGNRFLQAILWAYHEGITTGTTATTFSPNSTCTRGQVVMFLYRYAGTPEIRDAENPFGDVTTGNRFYSAIMWAVEEGITTGKTADTFDISGQCTRAQVVTFLYRYLEEKKP